MSEWKRFLYRAAVPLVLILMLVGAFTPASTEAQTNGNNGNTDHKITICHATRSATNPFVEITVDEHAVDDRGHDHHQDARDIIPAPASGCPGAQHVPTATKTKTPTNTPEAPTATKTKTPTPTNTRTTEACVNPNAKADLVGTNISMGIGVVHNNSTVCSYDIGVAVYLVPSGNPSDENVNAQILLGSALGTIGPGETKTLDAGTFTFCVVQQDLFFGSLITSFAGGARYGDRLLDFDRFGIGGICGPTATVTN